MRRNTGRARAAELRFYRHAVEETHAAIDDAAAAADDGGDASSLHVVVEVQRARGLAAVDKKGHAHPFCAITLVEATTGKALPKPHHKASRTRVVKGTTAPSWETTPERFAFDGVPVGAAGPPKLRVDVLSYTSLLSAPKPLGRAAVSLAGRRSAFGCPPSAAASHGGQTKCCSCSASALERPTHSPWHHRSQESHATHAPKKGISFVSRWRSVPQKHGRNSSS